MMFARLPVRALAAAAAPTTGRPTFVAPVAAAWAQTAAPWTALQQRLGLAAAAGPAPPKQPPNAWLLYTMERRQALKTLHPDMKQSALLKAMGSGFKQNWERAAAEAKDKHLKEVAAYESKHGKIERKKRVTKAEKQAAAEKKQQKAERPK